MKKVIGFCLMLVIILLLQSNSYAALQGSGTQADPYRISTLEELNQVRNNLSAYYTLTANIDASETITWNNGQGFIPFGATTHSGTNRFSGTFDGAGHIIKNIHIKISSEASLFGYTNGCTVKNLGLININFTSTDDNAEPFFMGVQGNSKLENCMVTGKIESNPGMAAIGLITRNSPGTVVAKNCFANVELIGYYNFAVDGNCYSTSVINCLGIARTDSTKEQWGSKSTTGYFEYIYEDGTKVNGKGSVLLNSNFKDISIFSEFDFSNIWCIDLSGKINDGYPYLKSFEYQLEEEEEQTQIDTSNETEHGYAEGTSSQDRKNFKYYLGLDDIGITRLMLVSKTAKSLDFIRDDIIDPITCRFRKGIYYIDIYGKIKIYN